MLTNKPESTNSSSMQNDLLKILASSNKDIDSQKLMDYINGKLTIKENREIEEMLNDNSFADDAVEGLGQVGDQKKLLEYVEQLNQELHRQLDRSRKNRTRKKLFEYPWIYLAVILILVLCVIGFLLIRMYIK